VHNAAMMVAIVAFLIKNRTFLAAGFTFELDSVSYQACRGYKKARQVFCYVR
jgi:hypothetical protein